MFFLKINGTSPAVQWIWELSAFTAVAWVQALFRELRSHKPRGVSPCKGYIPHLEDTKYILT